MAHSHKNNNTHTDFLIESLRTLPRAIAKTFGSKCEVVLHDLRQLEKSVVEIEHGHITGRKVGSSITDLGLRAFKKDVSDLLLNYSTTAKDGRSLKSTTVFFRDKERKPIAALCINIDITDIKKACSVIEELSQANEGLDTIETFETDIGDTITSIIEDEITKSHPTIPAMKKEDRMEIVCILEGKGVFRVKGAIKMVAKRLNVSKFAIYNYLEETRTRGPGR
jgi:predicted transcriptional regulator YheO